MTDRVFDLPTPAEEVDCTLWLRADQVTLDGSNNVSTWRDLIIWANNHHTQATSTKRPAWEASGLNTRASMLFDGVDDFLSCTTTLAQTLVGGNDTAFTLFIVAQGPLAAGNAQLWTAGSSVASRYLYVNPTTGGTEVVKKDDTATSAGPSGAAATNGKHVIEVVMTGTAVSLIFDGTTNINAGACNVGVTTLDTSLLGGLIDGGTVQAKNWRIAEVIAYFNVLNATRRSMRRKQLGLYYGITVS